MRLKQKKRYKVFYDDVSALSDKYTKEEFSFGEDTLDYTSKAIGQNNEILEKYQQTYKDGLLAEMQTKDGGQAAKDLSDYAESVQNYNDALLQADRDDQESMLISRKQGKHI